MRNDGGVEIALVVYPGVLGDECDAFASVLGRLPDSRVTVVGRNAGRVQGVGTIPDAECAFGELEHADIVVIPGGLGCQQTCDDAAVTGWLRSIAPGCEWVVASSTGSVILAAAGLLDGHAAATHWLAVDLLKGYGVEDTSGRLVVSGNIVTCEGRISALDAAYTVVEHCAGAEAVQRIRYQLLEHDVADTCPRRWYRRVRSRTSVRRPTEHPAAPPPVTIELVGRDDLPGRQRRRSRPHR